VTEVDILKSISWIPAFAGMTSGGFLTLNLEH